MKVIIATMVKDEVDIIEHWINYHGKIFGYNNLFIVDNMSTDGTYKICKKYKNSHSINIKKHPKYIEKGKEMMKIMNENKCDIFFPIDIDEFIVLYNRNIKRIEISTIKTYLTNLIKLKGKKYNFFKCDYLNPVKTNNNDHVLKKFKHAMLCDTYGDSRKTFIYNKNLKDNFNKDKNIDHGNHMGSVDYFVCDICLVHYHCRSHEQKYKKSVNNSLGLGHDINIQKLENGDKNELKKLKIISEEAKAGGHHPRSLYGYYSGRIKTYEPRLFEVRDNFIEIKKIYDFLFK